MKSEKRKEKNMDKKVKRVMDFIHGVAYNEVDINRYVEFLELIEYELERELDGGDLESDEY